MLLLRLAALIMMLCLASPLSAQQSDAAAKKVSALFMSAFDALMKTTPSLGSSDYDAWEAAAKKAGIVVERRDLLLNVPRFKPLFDSNGKVLAGAVSKYSARLGQIPKTALSEWQKLTGLDPLFAGMSLTVEEEAFPKERYSETGFKAAVSKIMSRDFFDPIPEKR
jgi:hypothetical protein